MAVQTMALANVQTYLDRVDRLYSEVRNWMTALEPDAKFFETVIELNEESTGPYKAKSLDISRTAQPALRLIPRGRYMVGAEGRVDVRSRLGRETLVWIQKGGPAVGFRFSSGTGSVPEEVLGRDMFPGVAEGWAWADDDRPGLEHLDLAVFRDRILSSIGTNG